MEHKEEVCHGNLERQLQVPASSDDEIQPITSLHVADEDTLVGVLKDSAIVVWQLSTGQVLTRLSAHHYTFHSNQFATSRDGAAAQETDEDHINSLVSSAILSPNELVVGTAHGGVYVIRFRGEAPLTAVKIGQHNPDPVAGVAVISEARLVVSVCEGGECCVWDVAGKSLVSEGEVHEGVNCLALLPDANGAVIGFANGEVSVLSLPYWNELVTWLEVHSALGVQSVATAADGAVDGLIRLWSGGHDGVLRGWLWQSDHSEVTGTPHIVSGDQNSANAVHGLASLRSGVQHVAVVTIDFRVTVVQWNVKREQEQGQGEEWQHLSSFAVPHDGDTAIHAVLSLPHGRLAVGGQRGVFIYH